MYTKSILLGQHNFCLQSLTFVANKIDLGTLAKANMGCTQIIDL